MALPIPLSLPPFTAPSPSLSLQYLTSEHSLVPSTATAAAAQQQLSFATGPSLGT